MDSVSVVTGNQISAPIEHVRNITRSAKITAWVGIAHAVLILIAFAIASRYGPGPDASEAEVLEFYRDDHRRQMILIAGIYLIPFAGIAFIWFTVALRMWLQGTVSRLNALFANILLVCGIIYVTLLFCQGAAFSMLSFDAQLTDEIVSVPASRQFATYGASLFLIFAMRMAAMIVFALTTIAKPTNLFPRWFIYSGYVVGIALLLTASVDPLLVCVFPLWLIGLCFIILRYLRNNQIRVQPIGVEVDPM